MAKERTEKKAGRGSGPAPADSGPPSLAPPDLAEWKMLPDIGLYMDQIVTFLERQLDPQGAGEVDSALTPSMINNYIKGRVLPRTEGKKYSRDHLARLLVLSSLKPVLSIPELAVLLKGPDSGWGSFEEFYGLFRRIHAESFEEAARALDSGLRGIPPGAEAAELRNLALGFAVRAKTLGLAAEKLLARVEALDKGSIPPGSPSS